MGKKRGGVEKGAWDLLRITLLWARKGGLIKRRLIVQLRQCLVKAALGNGNTPRGGYIFYKEHQLSFDKTPIFHHKANKSASMRFFMSCISQQVDFEYNFKNQVDGGGHAYREYEYDEIKHTKCGEKDAEEGIDLRAEKFIAQFYEQMRLQSLEYSSNDTP